jgi:hypothetical protein
MPRSSKPPGASQIHKDERRQREEQNRREWARILEIASSLQKRSDGLLTLKIVLPPPYPSDLDRDSSRSSS